MFTKSALYCILNLFSILNFIFKKIKNDNKNVIIHVLLKFSCIILENNYVLPSFLHDMYQRSTVLPII